MKVEYSLLTVLVGAVYALLKHYLPDFPVSDDVFQLLIGYLLVKVGVEVVGKPADALRAFFKK